MEWIKYDGTNKPDDGALVRVGFPDGHESSLDDWTPAGEWDWYYHGESSDYDQISRFMIKGADQ